MLSSSPSLLLSTLSPLSAAGDAAATGGEAAPGFAELLNGLATKASEAISAEDAPAQGEGEQAVAADAAALTKGKTLTVRAGRLAVAADRKIPAAALAAIESGKILPAALPEAAETDDKADAGAEAQAVATDAALAPTALPVLPGTLPMPAPQTGGIERALATAPSSPRRATAAAATASTNKVNPAAGQPADKAKPETPTTDARPVPAVAITVAAPVAAAAAAEPAAPARPKPARAADLARIEAPLPQVSMPAAGTASFAQPDISTQAASAPMQTTATPMPSPNDIDAALDHLVAAREALMPAEAALAIDHAEFGEVSIKFEQSSDGRLSAELTAADPELKRAVTAAVATDRGPAMTSDGDSGRSAQTASHRGSAAGGDATTGGRGQSGADRDGPQRHTPTRSQARQAATDQRPGVFA